MHVRRGEGVPRSSPTPDPRALHAGTLITDGVRLSTLPSGVRVVTETMPEVRSVAVGFWVAIGSRDERAPVAGASHFLEHLLFKGTRRRSAQEIAETVDAVGGDLNAFTSKEYTCFYGRSLDRDFPLVVDILGDMITSALIRSADVESERQVVLEEISMHVDTPDDLVHSVFAEAFFGPHPLGREVLGSEETIRAMTRQQVNRYYRRHYTPDNLVVAVAGSIDHDSVVAQVEEALVGWEPEPVVAPGRTQPRAVPVTPLAFRKRPTEQAHVVLGGVGFGRGDERRFAASVLNQATGGGMASRLFQEVREQRGLAYSVYSYLGTHADAGTFAVYAGTTPTKTSEVLGVIRGQFERLLDEGLSEPELARAKGHLSGSMVLALEDTGSRMTRLGKALCTDAPLLSLDETIARIDAVTPPDIEAVIDVVARGPFTLAVVAPFPQAEARRLERYAAGTAVS